MSVFEEGTTPQKTETQESFLQKLVETKGEQWKDPEVLAKGKLASDEHIANLEAQIAELSRSKEEQDYAKKLLEQLEQKAASTTKGTAQDTQSSTTEAKTLPAGVDIKSLVEESLRNREVETKVAQNIKTVEEQLKSVYGTEVSNVLKTKATELGMSLAQMENIAKESPTAFFRLVDVEAPKKSVPTPSNSVNTASFTKDSSIRDYAFYSKMRKENPTLYNDPRTQAQMHIDAETARRNGKSFF